MKRRISKAYIVILVALGILGFAVRLIGINHVGIDMRLCLLEWTDKMVADGQGLNALKEYSGDYNMPYATLLLLLTYLPFNRVYSIKALSILFDYLLAGELAFAFKKEFGDKQSLFAFGLVIFNPIAIMNSSFLGQCDAIYVSFCVLSFLYLYKDKPVRSMIALALAFAFKLQTVFVLPILAVLYWKKKKLSVLHLFILPIVWEIVCLPAIIAGRGLGVFYDCYLNQTSSYEAVYYYYPNMWSFFQSAPYYHFGKIAIVLSLLVMAFMFVLIIRSSGEDYFSYFIWMAIGCTLFLPSMHERYAFLPEMVLPVVAIVKPKYRVPALLLVLSTTGCYLCSYFYNAVGWPPYVMSVINIGVFIYITCDLVPVLIGKNKGVIG